jgi:hypothetical protein
LLLNDKLKFGFIVGVIFLGVPISCIYTLSSIIIYRYYVDEIFITKILIPDILILSISYFLGILLYNYAKKSK